MLLVLSLIKSVFQARMEALARMPRMIAVRSSRY